ncbi:MAG: alpha/beta hydrolase [Clostridia bacterium]|nr:alpha/beta hydrolase [Clostridia bacterium]
MKIAALILSVMCDAVALYFLLRLAAGKSLTALIAEGYLYITGYRRRFSKRKEYERYFAERSAENEKPFSLPEKFTPRAPLTAEACGEMPVYIFNGGKGDKRVFYLHGGAYLNRPQKMHWRFLDGLATRTGCEIVVPLYPLLPKHTGEETFSLVRDFYLDITADGKETVLMGDSSGGGLAAAIAISGVPAPSKIILLSPWTDVSMSNPALTQYDHDPLCALYGLKRLGRLWAKDCGVDDERVSPVNGDLSALRNVTVFAGERELIYPDIRRFCDRIPESELIVGKNLHHVYPLYPTPEAKKALKMIVDKF